MTGVGRALVTGGGGFLGQYVVAALEQSGQVVTILRHKSTGAESDLVCDLSKGPPSLDQEFESVYHLAGLAHRIARSGADQERFQTVNVTGTLNLLRGLESVRRLPRALVFVSTVAVYGLESGTVLDELTPRAAADPYGYSKRQAEDLVMEWGDRHGVRVGIARLPLVAGKNPPGNLGAMIRAIRKGHYVGIGTGQARRSMVLASDVSIALPRIAERGGIYHLTDGHNPAFSELEASLCPALGKDCPQRLPLTLAQWLGRAGDLVDVLTRGRSPLTTNRVRKMTSTLTFSDEKARHELEWVSSKVVDAAPEIVGAEDVPPELLG